MMKKTYVMLRAQKRKFNNIIITTWWIKINNNKKIKENNMESTSKGFSFKLGDNLVKY